MVVVLDGRLDFDVEAVEGILSGLLVPDDSRVPDLATVVAARLRSTLDEDGCREPATDLF